MGGKPTEGLVGITVTSWLIGLKKNVYAQNVRISNDRHLIEIHLQFPKNCQKLMILPVVPIFVVVCIVVMNLLTVYKVFL